MTKRGFTQHQKSCSKKLPVHRGKFGAGFTIFFAVLVGSLALSIGLSIYELLIRELALSQIATQSQFAIYAADAGAECALYWDNKCTPGVNAGCFCTSYNGASCVMGTAFASSSIDVLPNPSSGIRCSAPGGTIQDIAAHGWPSGGANPANPPDIASIPDTSGSWVKWDETPTANDTSATTNFIIVLGNLVTSPCAKVTVSKVAAVAHQPPQTTVTSRGYNSCSSRTPTRVERAFQVTY